MSLRWNNPGWVLAVIMLAAMPGAYVRADLDKGTVLTRQVFIADALTRDPEFNQALQQYLQAKYTAVSAGELADWTLGASVGGDRILAGNTETDSLTYQAWLEKLFLASGTRTSLAHENVLTEVRQNSATQSSEPVVSLSVTQPLMKNAFGMADRYPVAAADLQRKAAYDDAVEAWENRILVLEKAYLSWCDAYETAKAYQAIVTELARLENQVQRKFKARISDEKDLVQAQENLMQYQNKLLESESVFRTESMNIAVLRGGDGIDWSTAFSFIPEKNTAMDMQTMVLAAEKIHDLRLMKKYQYAREQQQIALRVAENASLPELDVTGKVALGGASDDLGGGYGSIADTKEYSVLLTAEIPLGQTKASGDQGRIHAALAEIDAAQDQTQRSLLLGMNQIAEQLTMMVKTLAIKESLVKKAERKLQLDARDYEIGRLDIYYLIDAQNGLNSAQLDFNQSRIDLEKAKLAYLALTDQLGDRYSDKFQQLQP